MKNPNNFDGKSPTAFNQWWEAVTMFLGFYPDTNDRQKIAWIGTLLTDTALVWHLNRYRELGDNDTWVYYVAAIRAEYYNEREAADAQFKLGQLKYEGSIRTYMTEFRGLNTFARATGEGLREKIDMAMPDGILDMRFNQNPGDLVDDEQFLQATYQAGIQVEKKKALKKAKEAMRTGGGSTLKEGKKGGEKEPVRNQQKPQPPRETDPDRRGRGAEYGEPGHWETEVAALEGVPITELREHRASKGCHRCGRSGHRAAKCYAGTTKKGTNLPPTPWKIAAVPPTKKRRQEDGSEEEAPTPKQPRIGAIGTRDTLPLWDDREEDF